MTFAALTLNAGSSGSSAAISSVTVAVGASSSRRADYVFWGWSAVASPAPQFGPDSAIGAVTPSSCGVRGFPLMGVYASDGGTATSNASQYYVLLAGSAPTGAVNTLTVGGVAIGANVLGTITLYQPSYTIFQFSMTTPAAQLFGTSGTKTIVIT